MNTRLTEFTLRGGRRVYVAGVVQMATYGSVIEGRLTAALNEMILDGAQGIAESLWPEIAYTILNYEQLRGNLAGELPCVHCTAHLNSFSPARDRNAMASALNVIWYQPGMLSGEFPVEVIDGIVNLDWDRLATDFDW